MMENNVLDESNIYDESILGENTKRIKRQKGYKLDVIIGNPPYSAGQTNANDNNQNTSYPALFEKIANSYAKNSTATNKNSLYDTYKLAIKYATDRLDKNGIIAYVTNGSFIDGNADDGLRQCLEQEFSYIYIVNLRGNARTSGEARKQEGGGIFDSGSRAPVAITLLIKDETYTKDKATIYYYDIGDYLTRERKLEILQSKKSIKNIEFQTLVPNKFNDWINQRDDSFNDFFLIGSKDKKNTEETIFENIYSSGIKTNRDDWIYNFSKENLQENMKNTIDFYNNELEKCKKDKKYNFNKDNKKISWSDTLIAKINRQENLQFNTFCLTRAIYRPFTKSNFYYYKPLIERTYQFPKIFPTGNEDNLIITLNGIGNRHFVH